MSYQDKQEDILETPITHKTVFTAKDLVSDQEIRWCPGCGDYSVLKQVQTIIPDLGLNKEEIVFVSGIGCSSRFPYYMNTFGIHSIHGRATALASGLKIANPKLSVWIVTGDGDALSIGGNHFIHLLRRNLDVNILLFNNQIYGLTKGQYSPTSLSGQITKSSPYGVIDAPFNPLALSLGADASFVARTMDRDPKHLQYIFRRGAEHKGSSMIEIYQNCNVFNDGAFFIYTDKETKAEEAIFVEHNKPLIFGKNQDKGIILDGTTPKIVNFINENISLNDLWVHDENDLSKALILSRFYDSPNLENHFPRPFGVIYTHNRACYEKVVHQQINDVITQNGKGDLEKTLLGNRFWQVD